MTVWHMDEAWRWHGGIGRHVASYLAWGKVCQHRGSEVEVPT